MDSEGSHAISSLHEQMHTLIGWAVSKNTDTSISNRYKGELLSSILRIISLCSVVPSQWHLIDLPVQHHKSLRATVVVGNTITDTQSEI